TLQFRENSAALLPLRVPSFLDGMGRGPGRGAFKVLPAFGCGSSRCSATPPRLCARIPLRSLFPRKNIARSRGAAQEMIIRTLGFCFILVGTVFLASTFQTLWRLPD